MVSIRSIWLCIANRGGGAPGAVEILGLSDVSTFGYIVKSHFLSVMVAMVFAEDIDINSLVSLGSSDLVRFWALG